MFTLITCLQVVINCCHGKSFTCTVDYTVSVLLPCFAKAIAFYFFQKVFVRYFCSFLSIMLFFQNYNVLKGSEM